MAGPVQRLHRVALDAETRMSRASAAALDDYLATCTAAVLDHDTRRVVQHLADLAGLTAAPRPDELPPDLDAWPPATVWQATVRKWLVPVAQLVFRNAFGAGLGAARDIVVDSSRHVARYLADTTARLTGSTWPDEVYDRVRAVVDQGHTEHWTIADLRDRVRDILGPDRWKGRAETIARTESLAAVNAGAHAAGVERIDVLGQQLRKRWLATDDEATRPAHHDADGTTVDADQPFLVGGELMLYPHDPHASAANTVNCRCLVLWLDPDEEAAWNNADTWNRDPQEDLVPAPTPSGDPLAAAATPPATPGEPAGQPAASVEPETATTPAAEPDAASTVLTASTVVTESAPLLQLAAAGGAEPTWAEQIAAAVPAEPEFAAFEQPPGPRGTKMAVTDEKRGWVAGYIADWDARHRVHQVPPPRDPYGGVYPKFHRHSIRTADGRRVLTGPIATSGHGDITSLDLGKVIRHYDDPRYVVANVRVQENPHGIWASGSLRHGVEPWQVAMLDAYSQSGHWMPGPAGYAQELVASCCVTVEAFELPNPRAARAMAMAASVGMTTPRLDTLQQQALTDAEGNCLVLVAAGVLLPPQPAPPLSGERLFFEFKAAQARDSQVNGAAQRVFGPAVTKAAARIGREM